jgi:hypothetical protein
VPFDYKLTRLLGKPAIIKSVDAEQDTPGGNSQVNCHNRHLENGADGVCINEEDCVEQTHKQANGFVSGHSFFF